MYSRTSVNILFYIEPMMTFNRPLLHLPWWNFAYGKMVSLEKDPNHRYSFRVITSEAIQHRIIGQENLSDCKVIGVDSFSWLKHFDGDYLKASLAWYHQTDTATQRSYAAEFIIEALGNWKPDLVISYSPAPFIQTAYPDTLILYSEYGMTSRPPFPESFYFDPEGYYQYSYLCKHADMIKAKTYEDNDIQGLDTYRTFFINLIESKNPFKDLIKDFRTRYENLLLVPLQASQCYWFNGNCHYSSQFQMVEIILNQVPETIGIIFCPHPDFPIFTSDVIEYLTKKYPHFIYSPEFERYGAVSQYLINHVDAVASVSSMVGLQSLIWKKKLIALGNSQLNFVADAFSLDNLHDLLNQEYKTKDNELIWLLTEYYVPISYINNSVWFGNYIQRAITHWKYKEDPEKFYTAFDKVSNILASIITNSYQNIPIVKPSSTASNTDSKLFIPENKQISMEFTGERYIPNLDAPEISYEHWHRYLYATQFVKDKVILDIACGEGYGSYLLAQYAKHVVGVDINVETINHAISSYSRENLEFKVGSLSHIPFQDEAIFDGIVSFESIEHVSEEEQIAFMKEVKRVLKPGGFLLISTPNKLTYSDLPVSQNEFHVKEFYPDEFRAFLETHFRNVVLLGQRIYPVSYIWDIQHNASMFVEFKINLTPEGFRPSSDEKVPLYIVAICSDEDISQILQSIQVDLSDRILTVRDEKIGMLSSKLAEKEQQNQEANKSLVFSKELVRELIHLVEMLLTQLHAQNQYLLEYKIVKDLLTSAQKISNLNYRLPLFYLCVNLLQRLGEKESKDKLIKDIKQIGMFNLNNKIGASIRKYLYEVDLKEQAYLLAQNNFEQIIQATDMLDEIENHKEILTLEFIDIIHQQAIRANMEGDEELSKELLAFADIVTKMTERSKQSEQTYNLNHPTENEYFSLLFEALFINSEIENKAKPIPIEPVKPPRKRQRHLEPIDIIICVHNALEDVERCLLSITKHTTEPYNLILVDDGSDEPTRKYLVEYTEKVKNSMLIRNENARGYTRAANQAMQKSKSNILVLLNSDTIVGPDWLDGLYSVMETDEKIGVVGPLSNTASWQSIPKLTENGDWAMNPLPDGLSVDEMSYLIRKYAAGLELYVPLLNGFCLMIRREVINQIGYFNEELFGDGYGEEDDFNLRAQKAGWKLAIADDVYIFHAQSKSYSTERRRQLAQRAGIKLRELHGDDLVNFSVNCMNPHRVLEGIRARTNTMLEIEQVLQKGRERFAGKKVLFVLPVLTVGGGANVVIDEARCMRNMGVDVRIFNINSYKEGFLRAYPHLDFPVVFGDQKDLIQIASSYDAVIATANFSVEWLKSLDSYSKPILGYYIQGFEPWMYDTDSPEFTRALRSYTLIKNIISFTKTDWTQQTVYKYTGLKPTIVGVSVNINLFRPRDTRIFGEKPIKIVSMIRAESKYRKPDFTMELLRRLKKEYKESVLIQLFGTQDIRYSNLVVPLDFDFEQYGILTQLQVANLLSKADIFVDFSEHQAMGLTALEAMSCGCAVIVPKNGGAVEFVQNQKNGLVVDTNNPNDCYDALRQIVQNDLLRIEIQLSALNDVVKYFPEKPALNILNCLFMEHKSASQKFVNKKRKK
jgi:GT2 family glycosyltransferase/2-polyprenyl-3-methyl-5-hydroxy-6-metoxy-1,4-benzoquinol methylase